MKKRKFEFFADTGGTFTDCIAIDDEGKYYRKKVLSNGSIRGDIIRFLDKRTIQINEKWGLKTDILKGYRFNILKADLSEIKVKSYDPGKKILCLDTPLPELENSTGFELYSGEEAPVLGARLITGASLSEDVPVGRIKLGSTKGTNALLERKGSRVLFLVTKGFKDLLLIRYQQRPDIFSRNVIKPDPLYHSVVEVSERIGHSGEIILSPDSEQLRNLLKGLKKNDNYDTVAVALINSYKNPVHEKLVRELLIESGFSFISLSSELSSLIKYIPRAETTVVNSYLDKIIYNYLDNIKDSFPGGTLHVMNSSGGLVRSAEFNPKESLLSGPAGGVVGAASIGMASGFKDVLTFDMGGTSTDVSRFGGSYDYTFELEVGDARIFSPALSIETVAAGGGSLCYFDGFKLCVGPESAGAFPGPACYGAGGPLTITDINLLSGRLEVRQFGIPVYPEESEQKLHELIGEIEAKSGKKKDKRSILKGFLVIANEIMAGAIKKVSVSKGYDPAGHALVAFGGAGGMHAISIAELLNISTILLPEDSGLLSAYGMSRAVIERISESQVLKPLEKIIDKLEELFEKLSEEAVNKLKSEDVRAEEIQIRSKIVYLRFKGQDSVIDVEFKKYDSSLIEKFQEKYKGIYGYDSGRDDIEVESIRVIASSVLPQSRIIKKSLRPYYPEPDFFSKNNFRDYNEKIRVFLRKKLHPGAIIEDFALILDEFSTWVIEDEWRMEIDESGTALLKKIESDVEKSSGKADISYREIDLELFTNRFMSIAESMGSMLQRISVSVNVKERLDFSCALLDEKGDLVANAPHIPVHLGSLGVCVRKLKDDFDMGPGDTIITNHPEYGGSHLPDITLVTPVYSGNREHLGYVVNRAHHAEIGGKTPGSMPPDATLLKDEGVIIPPAYLVKNGVPNWDDIKKIFINSPYPSRAVDENIADLRAALAANKAGETSLIALSNEHGMRKVKEYMGFLKDHARLKMEETLSYLREGTYTSEEFLDDGSPLRVKIDVGKRYCRIDFSGSGDIHPGNMNATEAIVKSVVIYVLRLLIDEKIPLNDGILEPVEIVIPKGMLNPGFPEDLKESPAIVGGNIEVSQRLTDTLLKPFNILACSQGTMNNVLFGNENFSYYETICGGCGAGNGFNGASAVHHHMTNTKITDPEILEYRYPVRIESFLIRKGSGGEGKFSGGDGVIRVISFQEPVSLSVLTQHRDSAPYGLMGGAPGKPGEQYILTKSGNKIPLGSVDGYEVKTGDKLVIETPGGGGYGS